MERRWKMNRAGILNFWYYDEEEFLFEDGRMILRGANGSGKSVTMQSFLPLVLDGDKRPHRLDPFGSRDRRIEYYLLGDSNSGKTDAIAYLWMEFAKPEQNLFKTIGIGLRARRGAAQVQFWGFVLEDGRRIGRDFWLYDRAHWLEHHVRQPLARRELEEKIGSGGQVVQEQGAYRELVNRQLFGYSDPEAYQDLLHLMIQLRSPKLSKDFKPSAIYEILHQALPPLHEDELRPLSEVLEDMDQIADRLDEIRIHLKEMNRLNDIYDRYNKMALYIASTQVLEHKAEYDEGKRRMMEVQRAFAQAEQDKQNAEAELQSIEQQLQRIFAELDVLENHEAIGKQRELETVIESLKDALDYKKRTDEQIGAAQTRKEKLTQLKKEAESLREQTVADLQDNLEQLEAMAQHIEFDEHPIYHRYWMGGWPEDDRWRELWKRDLHAHRDRLEQALQKARQEREAAALARELERELGEARRERDMAERERDENERQLDEAKDRLRESVLLWKGQLQYLPFDDEANRKTLAAISAFGSEAPAYEAVRQPAVIAFEKAREKQVERRLHLQRERDALLEERGRLREELREWERSKEPEPTRSEARMKTRRVKKAGEGAPLYEVCDFRTGLDEPAKARLEEALERSGLLDAWITPDGHLISLDDDQEEVWIIADPHDFGYTLADLLQATPSEQSGLDATQVDAVLRTFLWDEDSDVNESSAPSMLTSTGFFRLGPLAGKGAGKERAEFIGRETRKRTRLLEMDRIRQEIKQLDEQLERLDEQINGCQQQVKKMKEEAEQFPAGTELQRSLKRLQEAEYRLQACLSQEQRLQGRYANKAGEWRSLQNELAEFTRAWTRLKREQDLQEAIWICRDYEARISEQHSLWRSGKECEAQIARLDEEREELELVLDEQRVLTEELEERIGTLRSREQALQKAIDELGFKDVSGRITALKAERETFHRSRKKVTKALQEASNRSAEAKGREEVYNEQWQKDTERLETVLREWRRELERGLVKEWREFKEGAADLSEAAAICKHIHREYDKAFAGRSEEALKSSLLEQFNAVRIILTEYVLETEVDETSGRILIYSMRDRTRPQPPTLLLEELRQLEAEQTMLLSEKDRELYEEIILRSVGKSIRQRIHRAEEWVRQMNRLMEERKTSSGLRLKLLWLPKAAATEEQMDTSELVELLKRDSHRLREDEIDQMITHFRSQIGYAKQSAQEEQESLRIHLYETLDYRNWFQFELRYRKGQEPAYRPLTDSRFNVLSGGEKAMAMYIPLFVATWSRYSDARPDAPRIISLDEAFAGVDEENMRDMFKLLTDMGFDYMMTSQVLWGCYDTVPRLSIYEIHRPQDVDFVTLFRYRWNGKYKAYVENAGEGWNEENFEADTGGGEGA